MKKLLSPEMSIVFATACVGGLLAFSFCLAVWAILSGQPNHQDAGIGALASLAGAFATILAGVVAWFAAMKTVEPAKRQLAEMVKQSRETARQSAYVIRNTVVVRAIELEEERARSKQSEERVINALTSVDGAMRRFLVPPSRRAPEAAAHAVEALNKLIDALDRSRAFLRQLNLRSDPKSALRGARIELFRALYKFEDALIDVMIGIDGPPTDDEIDARWRGARKLWNYTVLPRNEYHRALEGKIAEHWKRTRDLETDPPP